MTSCPTRPVGAGVGDAEMALDLAHGEDRLGERVVHERHRVLRPQPAAAHLGLQISLHSEQIGERPLGVLRRGRQAGREEADPAV